MILMYNLHQKKCNGICDVLITFCLQVDVHVNAHVLEKLVSDLMECRGAVSCNGSVPVS